MSTQVQCPNCGGYRVESVNKVDNKETNRQHVDVWGTLFVWGLIFLFGGILCPSFTELWTGGWDPPNYTTATILTSLGIVGIVVGWRRMNAERHSLIAHYYHVCWLCGYRWNRRADEPLPEVSIRPDLIAKGEERLREEARQAEIEHHVAQDILNRKP